MIFVIIGLILGVYLFKDFFVEKKLTCIDKKEIHNWESKEGKSICAKCGFIWGED